MNAPTPVPQAVFKRFATLTANTTCLGADFMRKLQPCPIKIANRADGFSEYTLKPSCVKISICDRNGAAQGEIAED
jgi:hypothetical protein